MKKDELLNEVLMTGNIDLVNQVQNLSREEIKEALKDYNDKDDDKKRNKRKK